jgi:hypothetical protein
MTKRQLAWISACVLGVLAVAGAAWSAFGPEKIVLTEAQLQERAERELPREFRGVTVERITVKLTDGKISLHAEAHASAFGQAFVTSAFARGIPRYNEDRGEIFFDAQDVRLEDFRIGEGNSAERAERLGSRLGGRLGDAVERNLPRIEAAAAIVIEAGLKAYLSVRPVYRFKEDLKGVVLKATITNFAVVDETLVISLSPFKLTVAVAFWLIGLVVVLFLAVLLARKPGWGAKSNGTG